MNIIPSIDLLSGQCVRLYQGNYDQVTVYDNDVIALSKQFASEGATALHIVDLDGAREGKSFNLDVITQIAKESHLAIQCGGGIRTEEQLVDMFNRGISRVVLGSIAILNINLVKEWLHRFGEDKIILALDIRMDQEKNPKLALQGWQEDSELTLWQLLEKYRDAPLSQVLCTDIQRDGTLKGPNIAFYQTCMKSYPTLRFQASGGIGCLKHLQSLASISMESVVVGKAIYENKFSLKMAIAEGQLC
jgi:phosphoribosylformimino-5-aminoimidazole carboxamide ribotide isomerase